MHSTIIVTNPNQLTDMKNQQKYQQTKNSNQIPSHAIMTRNSDLIESV